MRTENERVTIDVGGAQMGGYLARPVPDDPHRFPAVLVFMEIFGINSNIRSVVDRIAAEGYVALAPDYFHRTAPGVEYPYDDEGRKKGSALAYQLRADEVLADAQAAIAYLQSRDDVRADCTGAIGFCIGGHVAYLVASSGVLRATASFYGGGIARSGLGEERPTVARTEGIRGKIICFFGADDESIPPSDVEKIRKALYDAGVRHEIFCYPSAGHAFFRDGHAKFRQGPADDAWRKTKKLFLDELHGAD